MPRPRVRPEERQRAAKACLPCKSSKKRCDAQQPCSNCVRRRAMSSCIYADSSRTRNHHEARQSLAASSQRMPTEDVNNLSVDESILSTESPDYTNSPRQRDSARGSTGSPQVPRRLTGSRPFLNSKGEKVYIGETGALSFLQFLRHIIRQQMGPSLFTETNRRNVMLEVSSSEDTNNNFTEDEAQKRALIDVYFVATNGMMDLFSREEIEEYLNVVNTPDHGSREYAVAALDLVIAIGGQCRASNPLDLRYAVRYFSRAQKAALAGGLEDPCLDMVRCFLLMTFYMLGACRRNAAFLYLGVASQASSALGLHVTEQYRHFSMRDQSLRLRTLKSLRILDVLVSTLLGRPYSTPNIRIDNAEFSNMHIHVGKPRDLTLNASFGACSLIAEISQSLDSENLVELTVAERFLQRLQEWSSRLPSNIRQFTKSTDPPLTLQEQEQILGNITVSCVYYFAVIVVTRPFLISHLMEHLPGGGGAAAEGVEGMPTSKDNSDVVDLAQACIDSAIYMAQMCHEALQSGLLLNQMCILKAWMFAAGLVLGFSMFARAERFDMDDAFHGAREVLKKLAEHSPQAEQYYEILTAFADAIQRHRQHLSREKRRAKNKYVNQILKMDVSNPNASVGGSSQSPFSPRTPLRDSGDGGSITPAPVGRPAPAGDFDFQAALQMMPDANQLAVEGSAGFDFGLFGWDNFAMQISENFSFDPDQSWANNT